MYSAAKQPRRGTSGCLTARSGASIRRVRGRRFGQRQKSGSMRAAPSEVLLVKPTHPDVQRRKWQRGQCAGSVSKKRGAAGRSAASPRPDGSCGAREHDCAAWPSRVASSSCYRASCAAWQRAHTWDTLHRGGGGGGRGGGVGSGREGTEEGVGVCREAGGGLGTLPLRG